MAGTMESLSTVNSFLRTMIALVVVGAVGAGGYFGYTTYNAAEIEADQRAKELEKRRAELAAVSQELNAAKVDLLQKSQQIEEQRVQIDELNVQVKKLETSLAFLKVDHRVARFTALDQTKDEATGQITTLIEFVEVNDEGVPIDTPRQFRLQGDMVYIDAWVIRFKDEYVEKADLERGTSLILFKRIFGSGQKPEEGFPLDEVGSAPRAYARGGKMSDFEKKIWDDFWAIANDPDRIEELGIRSASGDAQYIKVQKGKTYRINVRASGGPELRPEEVAPKPASGQPQA